MNKTNFLSTILVIVFMISCISFFNAVATEEETLNNGDTPSASASDVVKQTNTIETTAESTTIETTAESTTIETTAESTTQNIITTQKTTVATVVDPVFTQPSTKATSTFKTTVVSKTEEETEQATQVYENIDSTKATKEIKPTKPTEPTTPKKNITNYGSKFRPLKWISFILMLGSAAALVFVNVRYKKLYGKQAKKSKIDTNTKFTKKPTNQKMSDDTIDLSSFSRTKKSDDDLYI